MPGPSTTLGLLRPDIKGVLKPYDDWAAEEGYIGDRIYRPMNVHEVEGSFAATDIAAMLQAVNTLRGKDGNYPQVTWEWGKQGWSTKEHGLEERVDRRDAKRYGNWFDAEVEAAKRCRRLLLLSREVRIADKVFNASTYTPTVITNEWDDFPNATPVTDIHNAKKRLWAKGIVANAIILNKQVYDNARMCDEVKETLAAQGAGERNAMQFVGIEQLKQVFDVKHVLVGTGVKNTADEGLTGVIAPVWSHEYIAVARIAESDEIVEPCVGRTFHYAEDGSEIGGAVESYGDDKRRSDQVRVRMDVDELTMLTTCVELLSNATT